jgi:preprotein translocase subunit SecE
MARLQKKKSPDEKKRKKLKLDAPDEGGVSADGSARKKPAPMPKRTAAGGARAAAGPRKPNLVSQSIQFLREVKVELKKVTWPSRKQTMGSTVVVLVLTMIISLFLGVVDFGLSSLIRVVLQ